IAQLSSGLGWGSVLGGEDGEPLRGVAGVPRPDSRRRFGPSRCFTWNNAAMVSDEPPSLLIDGIRSLGLSLPRSAVDRLVESADLLRGRALPPGMTPRQDSGRLAPRHVLDSLRAVPVLSAMTADDGDVVDLGSGAGLPGVPLAIAMPQTEFVLAEARSKRAA